MFYHAYDGYLRYADGYDELKPLSCTGKNTWISSSLTLIDALGLVSKLEIFLHATVLRALSNHRHSCGHGKLLGISAGGGIPN